MANEKAITISGQDMGEENKPKKSFMQNLIEKARNLARWEPEKSLVAKGVTDTSDSLTEAGQTLFIDYLYRKNKADFVADPAVAELLAEKEEDEKE